ncbi:MAG: DUF1292 domain-containing protein [Eubacteriales bacterium]|nr:DUF1292 domain-containing protein [Eubacteriales bacterium]
MAEKQIAFITEDGEEIPFFVVEQTTISGRNYLLVTDSEEEEADAYIMREIEDQDGQCIYEFIEEEAELDALSKVFVELLDDVAIEVQE